MAACKHEFSPPVSPEPRGSDSPLVDDDGFESWKGASALVYDTCDICGQQALHPFCENLRKQHSEGCIQQHVTKIEQQCAVERSKDKVCGICFENIMAKTTQRQPFGLLPGCTHCFCLDCIRQWRKTTEFDKNIKRSCPECRTLSDFVCPNSHWVNTKEEKDRAIDNYKNVLSKKNCKYFKQGRGHCPFGNKCFYRHCLKNGEKVDLGPPVSENNDDDDDDSDIDELEYIQNLLTYSIMDFSDSDDDFLYQF